ncbi:MAG: hypothetical protein ACR2IA_13505 [Pyrinomonadaceae bacterium]
MKHELILILKPQKILVLLLFLALTILSLSCQKQTATSFENIKEVTQTKEIPNDWQKIETDDFSFSIPPTMKKNDVRGTDSPVIEFENDEITVHIENGDAAADLISRLTDFEGQKEQAVIDGEETEIVSYDKNKPIYLSNKIPDKDESVKVGKAEKNYVIGVNFPQKRLTSFPYPRPEILLVVIYKNSEMRNTARKILYSINFKQK